jgi:hypothetical protein
VRLLSLGQISCQHVALHLQQVGLWPYFSIHSYNKEVEIHVFACELTYKTTGLLDTPGLGARVEMSFPTPMFGSMSPFRPVILADTHQI